MMMQIEPARGAALCLRFQPAARKKRAGASRRESR